MFATSVCGLFGLSYHVLLTPTSKQFGSSHAIFKVMMEATVQSSDKLFWVDILLTHTIENILLACGGKRERERAQYDR